MKKAIKVLLIYLILSISNLSWSQNYSTYSIKEQYDKHNNSLVDIGYHPCSISPSNIADSYGDGMSYVLESYIKMYQTTKDKAYLIKFINNSICMFENRKDDLGISTEPRWGGSSMYQDGLIMWSMAHFYYLIFTEEPNLASLALPQIPNTKITNNSFGASFSTYGDYATWLRNRIDQTLVWYTYTEGYWGDDGRCYTPEANPSSSTRAQIINQQAGFASTLFYLGTTDPNTDYTHKAARIALAHKGSYIEKHPVVGCNITSSHSYPVLKLLSNNSYVWKTNGWREVTCNEFEDGKNDYEDISHGVQVLNFPRAIHNKLTSSGNMLFDDNDMIRFKNMFLYNIFAGYASGCPQFHSGIDGDDVCNYNHAFDGLNTKKTRALSYMPFYKFDDPNSSTTVYNIIMDYYTCDIANNINILTEGMDFNGLSEIIAAQWDKECVNLTLYNRDVIYNQDFYAKNTLSIEPEKNDAYHNTATDYPFAEPYIFTDNGSKNRFVVESSITVNLSAGESIILRPGFEAKQGSKVNCSIQQGTCTNGMKMANNNYLGNNISQNNNITSLELENDDSNSTLNKNEVNEILDIEIYPTPSSTIINLKCNDLTYNKIKNLKLVDITGKKHEIETSNKINIEKFPAGCYQLIINLDNQFITKKIIKINEN